MNAQSDGHILKTFVPITSENLASGAIHYKYLYYKFHYTFISTWFLIIFLKITTQDRALESWLLSKICFKISSVKIWRKHKNIIRFWLPSPQYNDTLKLEKAISRYINDTGSHYSVYNHHMEIINSALLNISIQQRALDNLWEDQGFSSSYDLAPAPTPPSLPSESLTGHTQEEWERKTFRWRCYLNSPFRNTD